jgi:hypothetical protein
MSRSINYNTFKGDIEDLEELLLEDEIITSKVEKIKKKKRFDDGTLPKAISKKVKDVIRKTEKA